MTRSSLLPFAAIPVILVMAIAIIATDSAAEAPDPADTADGEAAQPAPDVLRHAVDPYNPAAERRRFFAAAGPDRELTREQFEADREREDGFVRPFDTWEGMLAFDRNGNGTIDWFEADAYRHDLRRRVLAAFGGDRTGRLTGAARDRANAVLARGPLPETMTDAEGTGAAVGDASDGEADAPLPPPPVDRLSAQQRQALLEQELAQQQQRLRELYGTDDEDELGDEARAALRGEMRERGRAWRQQREAWIIQHFDVSGTGELDEDERAALRGFEGELQNVMSDFERRLLDFDGTGEVTEANRRAAQARYMPVFIEFAGRWQQWADITGDGEISAAEAVAFNTFAAEAVTDYFDAITRMHDADGDGVLDVEERAAMLDWLADDLDARFEAADRTDTGDLTPSEMSDFLLTLLEDIGIAPTEPEDEPWP